MSEFRKLLENENNIEYFSEAAKRGKLSHAYIISGAEGSGKSVLVENISAGLLCSSGGVLLCGKCNSCKKVLSNNHPDLIRVTHEKPNLISIGEIREQVLDTVSIMPFYGPHKIYIIEDAHLMNLNGQNALLKTLEEPPSYAIIFLITPVIDGLLETIRSRCITIEMDVVPDETVKNFLLEHYKITEEKAAKLAAFARGNIGLAESLINGKNAELISEKLPALLSKLTSLDAFEIRTAAKEFGDSDTDAILNNMLLWFRDVLVMKAAGDFHLYFADSADAIKKQANAASYEALNNIIESIDETRKQIYFNVKDAAAFDVLLLKIRELLK